MGLGITTTTDERGLLVLVDGEVDVSNAPELREALDAAIADDTSEASHLSIDISGVPYIDSTGIGVLVGTVHRAADRDMSVSVMRPQRNVARVLSLLGLDAELNVSDAQE